jgi:hypothetical protein
MRGATKRPQAVTTFRCRIARLGKDAKGFMHEWEEKPSAKRARLSIYTPDRVIELLTTARIIQPAPSEAAVSVTGSYESLGDWTLLIATYGKFRAIPVLESGVPNRVLQIDARTGALVRDTTLLRSLRGTDSTLGPLDFEFINRTTRAGVFAGGSDPGPPEYNALAADASEEDRKSRGSSKEHAASGVLPTGGRSGRTPAEPYPRTARRTMPTKAPIVQPQIIPGTSDSRDRSGRDQPDISKTVKHRTFLKRWDKKRFAPLRPEAGCGLLKDRAKRGPLLRGKICKPRNLP